MIGRTDQNIIVVAGVSSAGKSTFIRDILLPDLINSGHPRVDIDVRFARAPFA